MSSIGKITNSLLSATNENNVSLININLDVSLFRCEPPPEFTPVASALTHQRRKEAENGKLHKTASRLGFLFHDILPDTPKLIKAFGTRISEILAHPDVNPVGKEEDGPFRDFIGVDGTSIWAAATSGPAAIAILLLSCMLARAWDAKTATSIWFELIEERKRQIKVMVEANKVVSPLSYVAAQQDITRDDLATWDASARSWLRRADHCMSFQQTQFALIADNISVPFPGGTSTFDKVVRAWTRSMEVLEKLLQNLPQQACDRSVLLGIASWHLYPNLLVFQKEAKKVDLKDTLFPPSGVLSLGLEYTGSPADSFMRWSLALSHLRFYGGPVVVQSSEAMSRLPFGDLWLIVLGVVFRQWRISYANFGDAISWFQELAVILDHPETANLCQLSWLIQICSAVRGLSQEKMSTASRLVKYGWRRATQLLGNEKDKYPPFFGLSNPCTLKALEKKDDVEIGIEYLRLLALGMDLDPYNALISYNAASYTEWATISPDLDTELINPSGVSDTQGHHIRWLRRYNIEDIHTHQVQADLIARQLQIQSLQESCVICDDSQSMLDEISNNTQFAWSNARKIFASTPIGRFGLYGLRREESARFNLWLNSDIYGKYDLEHLEIKMNAAASEELDVKELFNRFKEGLSRRSIRKYLFASLQASQVEHLGFRY